LTWESHGGFIDVEAAALENVPPPLPGARQHQADTDSYRRHWVHLGQPTR
jgi:hypothetical protein